MTTRNSVRLQSLRRWAGAGCAERLGQRWGPERADRPDQGGSQGVATNFGREGGWSVPVEFSIEKGQGVQIGGLQVMPR